jgi:TolB protein
MFVADPGPSVAAFLMGADRVHHVIYGVRARGGGARILTAELAYNDSPVWSPDGRAVAYKGQDSDGSSEIYVVNANGSGHERLTDDGTNESPAWSPDGRRITFVHGGEIHVMDADGADRRALTGGRRDGSE